MTKRLQQRDIAALSPASYFWSQDIKLSCSAHCSSMALTRQDLDELPHATLAPSMCSQAAPAGRVILKVIDPCRIFAKDDSDPFEAFVYR
eukprot:2491146-Amphidinium_carterae.2